MQPELDVEPEKVLFKAGDLSTLIGRGEGAGNREAEERWRS